MGANQNPANSVSESTAPPLPVAQTNSSVPVAGATTGSSLDRLMMQREICAILKTSGNTLLQWREKGLPTYLIGNKVWYDVEELFLWIKANRKV